MSIRKLFGAFLASVVALAALPSEAAFKVEITVNGGAPFTIVDNGANDTNAGGITGYINYTGPIGALANFTIETATSNRTIGGVIAQLSNSIAVTNFTNTALVFDVLVTDTDFLFPGSGPLFQVTSEATGGLAGGTLRSYFNDNNGEFATQTPVTPVDQQIGLGLPKATAFIPGTTPYSLTQVIHFVVPAGIGQATPNLTTTTQVLAPEPTSLALLAMGGVGLVGGAIRRRRARKDA